MTARSPPMRRQVSRDAVLSHDCAASLLVVHLHTPGLPEDMQSRVASSKSKLDALFKKKG